MVGVASIVFASIFVGDPKTRVLLWAAAVGVVALINLATAIRPASSEMLEAIRPTESLVERFGLFTIIVLGEVVVGVANGLSETSHTLEPIITGLLALNIGFAFWWNYFDLVSGRRPRRGRAPVVWVFAHLALALCISAAGAGMVSLVEHATEGRTPAPTAWLIAGATAGVALSIAALSRTIDPHPPAGWCPPPSSARPQEHWGSAPRVRRRGYWR
jgi:low temperature requirement protein LtrA